MGMDALMLGSAISFFAFMLAALFSRWRISRFTSFAGCLLLFASLFMRWHTLGRPPWATLHETAAILALATGLAASCLYWKGEGRTIYMPMAAVTALIASYSAISWEESGAISPALESGWLLVHVPLVILSYGMFTVSFASSSTLLALRLRGGNGQAIKKLDSLSYSCITIGLALLVAGIIIGSLWAKSAWGSYWSWDPKETWSLITAAIYGLYIVANRLGTSPEDAALLSLLGFMAVLFTYLGVSYIIPGLHSYA